MESKDEDTKKAKEKLFEIEFHIVFGNGSTLDEVAFKAVGQCPKWTGERIQKYLKEEQHYYFIQRFKVKEI